MLLKLIKSKPKFLLFFLKNDEEQSVKVEEVEEVDLETIKRHLERGESVFITSRCGEQTERAATRDEREREYFAHI